MADESGETKPKVEGAVIQLVVKDQDGGEVHFKVKTHTKFEKIMTAYAAKKSLQVSGIRFLYEGTRLSPTSSPQEHSMQDDDIIDAMIEQVGGWQA